MSKFHNIQNYYINKAYRESLWAFFDFFVIDEGNDFLEIPPLVVMYSNDWSF